MIQKTLTLLFISFILLGCSSSEDKTEAGNLLIRISNVSAFNYENINVNTSGEMVNFGNLNASTTSEYKIFEVAYRYAFIELQIEGETFTFQPIDYVGETPLVNGKYSYNVRVNPANEFGKVTIELLTE